MKKVKEPAPHEKAAQIEKEAVRALSVDEVEEALTKSTYGAPEVKKADKYIEDLEDEILTVRAAYSALEGKYAKLEREKEDLLVLKNECIALNEEKKQLERHIELADAELSELKGDKKKLLREMDEMTKTISKMKYAHEEEVRALEDDLAESKILNKKAGEYSSMLDADSDAFETILELAKVIHGLAKSTESISLLIKDEVEGHV